MKESMAKRVAVIEDDRSINELVCYNLNRKGFLPTSIYDGQQAKETLGQEHFDIVVLDLMLPGLDGFALCKYLKQRPDGYKTFVVVLTARTSSTDKMMAHLVGADYYLTKPFSVDALLDIIKEFSSMQDKKFTVVCRDPMMDLKGGESFTQCKGKLVGGAGIPDEPIL